MQVSVEATSGLERKLTIDVPSDQVDAKVNQRLQEARKNIRINGFRPGKVPMSVVRKRFGDAIRNEILADVMRETYTEAVSQEKIEPAGMPSFEAVVNEAGKDLQYIATVELFPEVELADLSAVEVTRQQADIADADIDTMIEDLRSQRAAYEEADKAAADGDRVTIDFVGRKDGEEFDGGSATDHQLELGSGAMIPGFESGIEGHKAGEEFPLPVTFPEDYQSEDLKGQDVEFTITLKKVETKTLPEVDADFMKDFDVEDGDEAKFREEIKKHMERELKNAVEGKVKQQVMDALVEKHEFDLPAALVKGEVGRMRQQMMQQFGGGQQLDPSILPDDLFSEQAERSVRLGLVVRKIVDDNDLKADEDAVRARVEEIASQYGDRQEVIDYFYENPQQRQQIEGVVLEQKVVEKVLESAKTTDETVSYKEAVTPASEAEAEAAEEAEEAATTDA